MRYIGSKERLVETIYEYLKQNNVIGESFFDVYSGTTSIARFFKKNGYKTYSNDLMYFSYVLQKAYIENNEEPKFLRVIQRLGIVKSSLLSSSLQDVLAYLDNLPDYKGFIYNNYTPEGSADLEIPRMYYTGENGLFIDKVRNEIDEWRSSGLIDELEFYILCACLIETIPFYANISGVYSAFHKRWDSRALKKMKLRDIEIIKTNIDHYVYNTDSRDLVEEVCADIFYLDPPYNQRQYAPNYHILETVAKNDSPEIKGISGMRDYSNQKSKYCNEVTALQELKFIADNGKYKFLVLSYNCEGLMKTEDIFTVLKPHGEVELIEIEYLRYKSNSRVEKENRFIKEQLFILRKF